MCFTLPFARTGGEAGMTGLQNPARRLHFCNVFKLTLEPWALHGGEWGYNFMKLGSEWGLGWVRGRGWNGKCEGTASLQAPGAGLLSEVP